MQAPTGKALASRTPRKSPQQEDQCPPRSDAASSSRRPRRHSWARCSRVVSLRATKTAPRTPDQVNLTYWSWAPNMDKVVDIWNAAHPDIHVTVTKQAAGDDMVTKTHHRGEGRQRRPTWSRSSTRRCPTLVCNDVLADISKYAELRQERSSPPGVWSQVTLGGDARLRDPAGLRPADVLLPHRPVPAVRPDRADDLGRVRRPPRKTLRGQGPQQVPDHLLRQRPRPVRRARPAGRRQVVDDQRRHWNVGIDDAATKKVADFWGGLVKEGAVDNQPMYTPAWNKALNDGTQIGWVSAVWAPGVLTSAAPGHQGQVGDGPAAAVERRRQRHRQLGRLLHRRDDELASTPQAAAKFAAWLNTDADAVTALVKEAGIYPAATAAQTGSALSHAAGLLPATRPTSTPMAAKIAATTAARRLGPERQRRLQRLQRRLRRRRQGQGRTSPPRWPPCSRRPSTT